MRYTVTMSPGLFDRTGSFAVTTGVFHVETLFDPRLNAMPEFVHTFVRAHEFLHAKARHGLWSALFFFVAPLLRPLFEAQADRYAIERVGRENALRAMMILMPIARTQHEARVYGRDANERMSRAGI